MKFIRFLLIVLSIILFFWLAYWATDEFFEPKAYNYMVKTFTAHKYGSDNIVLIVIDDKSIGRHRWPWKRNLYCGIYDYFREYTNAKVIISDSIVTSDDDPVADKAYFDCLNKCKNLVVGMTVFSRHYENEKIGKAYDEQFKNKFSIGITDLRPNPKDDYLNSLVRFPKNYFNAVDKVGAITLARGSDGYVRVAIDAINYKGTLYPSLALRALAYINNETYGVEDRAVVGTKSKIIIPTNRETSGIFTLIRYYKHNVGNAGYSHKTYSAVDIMDSYNALKHNKTPLINPKDFDNKIVMVGANVKAAATGLSDVKRSPISNDHSGLDIQATTLDNYLNNYFMYELYDWQNIVVALLLMVATFFIIRNYSLFIAVSGISVMLIFYITLCALLYRNGFAINTITPISMAIITMIFAYSHKYIIEDKNKEKIKSAMGKYISEDIMKIVVKNIDELKLGVTRHNGVINKFIGDAVMAIFGEPIQDENHPKNAVRCACEMLDKVKELQTKWLEEGKPKIEIGIGINTGEAFVGNIGSEKRMEYTVIGDMVNLASRIEGNNKVYKTNLLISSSTFASARSIVDTVKISNVKIRGKEKTIDLYEVIKLIG